MVALRQMNDDILDIRAAARLIGAHPETLRRHIRAGRLPANKFGVAWMVTRSDLNAFARNYRPQRGPAFRGARGRPVGVAPE